MDRAIRLPPIGSRTNPISFYARYFTGFSLVYSPAVFRHHFVAFCFLRFGMNTKTITTAEIPRRTIAHAGVFSPV